MAKFSYLLFLTVLAVAIVSCSSKKDTEKQDKKKAKETDIGIYELKTEKMHAKLTNWGASLMAFYVPDKNGKMGDVVLGFDNVDDYKNDTVYFGATVGRVANRIGGAKFTLDGKTYNLTANDGKNTLHGGARGFSDVVWTVHTHKNGRDKPYITFAYESADGEEASPICIRVSNNNGGISKRTKKTMIHSTLQVPEDTLYSKHMRSVGSTQILGNCIN